MTNSKCNPGLQLFFAPDLETLTQKIIEEIKLSWQNPFDAPTVIFPDDKIQAWFLHRWIKNNPDAAVANLPCNTIDTFLFNAIKSKSDDIEKLSVDILSNVMLSYLQKDENWKNLDPYVTQYLSKNNLIGELDETKLFDFSITLSGLFLEYETSRPSNFIGEKGILDCWSQYVLPYKNSQNEINPDAYFFSKNKNGEPSSQEIFQRKLYSEIYHAKKIENQNFGDLKNPSTEIEISNQTEAEKICLEKSFLTRTFEMMNKAIYGEEIDGKKRRLTLPYLFKEKNQKFENAPPVDSPIYVFAISGMGQFYRVILEKLSETHSIKVFLQNPSTKFLEDENLYFKNLNQLHGKNNFDLTLDEEPFFDEEKFLSEKNENMILLQWGKTGRDNIRLYNEKSERKYFENDSIKNDSLLHCVQNAIINGKNKISNFDDSVKKSLENNFNNDFSLCVTSAPNKLREIENVYSKICLLLNNDKNLSLHDFLIYAPDINSYRAVIQQVFNQTERSDKNFVSLPYSIVDSSMSNSFTASAVRTFFEIASNVSLNRINFFALVQNPVVQLSRGITPKEIEVWKEWVSKMNVFRDRQLILENKKEEKMNNEWITGVKRLLLASFSSTEILSDDDEIFLPFEDINSSDKESLLKFVLCIESLEQWIENSKKEVCFDLTRENQLEKKSALNNLKSNDEKYFYLDQVKEFFSQWLMLPEELPEEYRRELSKEKRVFRSLTDSFEFIKYQFYSGSKTISFNNLSLVVKNSVSAIQTRGDKIFGNGITFMSFSAARTLPVKYTFFIGCGSNNFPGTKSFKSLDLRNQMRLWPGDENMPSKNRYGFLCQLLNSKDGFFISYESKDLKKDEDFYVSSVINDLHSFIKNAFADFVDEKNRKNLWQENKMSLEENRPWNELFTSREFRNKINKEILANGKEKKNNNIQLKENSELIKIIPVSYFEKFIKEPYSFQLKRKILESGSDDEAVESIAFENIQVSNFDKNKILEEMLKFDLKIPSEFRSQNEFLKYLKNTKMIPSGFFEKIEWEKFSNQVEIILQNYDNASSNEKFNSKLPPREKLKIVSKKIEYQFEEYNDGDLQIPSWTICSELPFYIEETNTFFVVKKSFAKNDWANEIEKLLRPYFEMLILAANGIRANCFILFSDSIKDSILLTADSDLQKNNLEDSKNIFPSECEAKEILKSIYKKIFVENYSTLLPIKYANGKEYESFQDYVSELTDSYAKNYIPDFLEFTEENTGFAQNSVFEQNENFAEQLQNHFENQLIYLKYLESFFEKKN